VGPALAGIISIFGGIVILIAIVQTILEWMLIKRARQIVGDCSEEQFALDFNRIDQDLRELPKINTSWSEFSETLIRPRIDDQQDMITSYKNTVRPHTYFNIRDLRMGPDFMRVFPSVFVGVGLSLTFLGLISALGEAVTAINASAGDNNSIQTAIGNLLKISSAKFYASLFALFMSVLITITLRATSTILNSALGRFNRSLEAGVRFLTPEKLSIEANSLLRNQLSQLQTFNTDLAMKIGEQLQLSLKESLQPVISKLENMGGDLTQQNIEAIKNISDEITKGIQGATGGSMDRVAAVLDEISKRLGGLSEALSGALSNFDVEFRQMLEGLKTSLQESTEGVAKGIGTSLDQMSAGIGQTANDVAQIIGGLTSTLDNLAKTGAQISKQGGEELRRQVEAASNQASVQIAQAGQELASGFQESTKDLVNALGSATGQLRQLEQGLVLLPSQLNDVNSRLGASASKIGEAADQFGAATSGIRGLIEPLAQYAADTRTYISEITSSMKETSGQIADASKGIQGAVEVLANEINAQLERLDGSDEQLAKLLSGIEDSTSRVLSEVNQFVTQVDNGFASSVGILQESISELESVVESIRKIAVEARSGY